MTGLAPEGRTIGPFSCHLLIEFSFVWVLVAGRTRLIREAERKNLVGPAAQPDFVAIGTGHCRVHIVFHGCEQSRAQVGDTVIRETGFADWAETNRIIVLFPQAAASALNPQTCWDWWGYTGPNFLTRDAPQIKAVQAMLVRLSEVPAG